MRLWPFDAHLVQHDCYVLVKDVASIPLEGAVLPIWGLVCNMNVPEGLRDMCLDFPGHGQQVGAPLPLQLQGSR